MKKPYFFLAAAFISMLAFASCKKDHVCKCNVTINIFGSASADTSFVISKETKKKARKQCTDYGNQLNAQAIFLGGSASCSLN